MKINKEVFFRIGDLINFKSKIFATSEKTFGKHKFSFKIIGKSHMIESRSLNFSEIFSCEEISEKNEKINLLNKLEKKLVYKFLDKKIKLEIKVRPLSTKHKNKKFDLIHVFKNGAFTGIKFFKNGYFTIHTYPEYSSEILTETHIEENGEHK